MRRALVVILLVAVLLALDATFNGFRVTGAVYREIVEFGRLFTRTIEELF
jgi:hypothetical protein